ncbi:MAG: TolC family protein [Pedosphaera sp.]|nr:TolC family protein [Pedosphaera sp.]
MKPNVLKFSFLATALAVAAVVPMQAADAVSAATNSPAVTNQVLLDDLVNEALEKNPELNFYRAEIAAARGGRKSAGAWANPEVSAEIGQKRVKDSSGALLGEGAAWAVSVNQTFEYPGRLSLRKAIANHDIQLAELGFSQFKLALAARVRTLGYNIFIAQEKLSASREVADRFQALTEVLVQRDSAGITPVLEMRIIEASTITLQRQASGATIAAQAALLELNQLRGQPPGAAVRVTGAQLNFCASPPLETLLDIARTNAFELRIRQAELEQQGFKVSLAKNERFSGVTVGPFISEEKAGERERTIGLGVSMPLPLWNRNTGNIETAKAREQQAQTSLLVTQREIERRVTGNALALQVKLDEMGKWRADSVHKFREAAELADRHYRLGAVPISTYVELQKQYLEAVEAVLDTKKESLEAAQALEQLTGATPLVSVTTKEDAK